MNSTVNRLISQSPMIVASQMLAAAEGVSVCLPVTEKSCSSRGPTIAVKAALNKIRRVPAIWSAKQRAEHIVCAACCSRPSGRPDDARGAPRTTRVTRWIYPTVPACFPTKPDPRILTCVRRLLLLARGVRRLQSRRQDFTRIPSDRGTGLGPCEWARNLAREPNRVN